MHGVAGGWMQLRKPKPGWPNFVVGAFEFPERVAIVHRIGERPCGLAVDWRRA